MNTKFWLMGAVLALPVLPLRAQPASAARGSGVNPSLPARTFAPDTSHAFEGWDSLLRSSSYVYNPDAVEYKSFSVTSSAEARHLIDEARAALTAGHLDQAARLLQQVLDRCPNHVYQVGSGHFLGAGEFARYLLKSLDAAGRKAYVEHVAKTAQPLYARALEQGDVKLLAEVAERYAFTPSGVNALLRLADAAFERGDLEGSALLYRESLLVLPEDAREVNAVLARLAIISRELRTTMPELGAAAADLPVAVKGTTGRLADLTTTSDDTQPDADLVSDSWRTYGGASARNRSMWTFPDRDTLKEAWGVHVFDDVLGDDPFRDRSARMSYPYQPIRIGDIVVVNNTVSVKAYNLYSGQVLWTHLGPMFHAADRYFDFSFFVDDFDQITISRNLIAGGTEAQGIVLCSQMVPTKKRNVHQLDGRRINRPIPERHLVALQVADGSVLWQQGDAEAAAVAGTSANDLELLSHLNIPSPPVVIGDTVYAYAYAIEGAINGFLVALDLRTGALRWCTPLCIGQQELTMFGMMFQELTAACASSDQRSIFVSTNLGVVASVDAATGNVRWLSQYDTIPIRPARHYLKAEPRPVFWYNNPVITDGNLLFVTPNDSEFLSVFDASTGKLMWTHSANGNSELRRMRYLLGVVDGLVILSGDASVRALDRTNGRVVWEQRFDRAAEQVLPVSDTIEATGRGALAGGSAYVPTAQGLFQLDVHTGQPKSAARWSQPDSGNVLTFRDLVVSAGNMRLSVFFDPAAALAGALERTQKTGASCADMMLIAHLYRLNESYEQALAYYQRALVAATRDHAPAEFMREVRTGLFKCYTDYGETLERAGRRAEAFNQFSKSREFADGPARDLDVVLRLLPLLRERDAPSEYLALIEEALAKYGSEVRVFAEGATALPVGLWVLLEKALFHREQAARMRASAGSGPADRGGAQATAIAREAELEVDAYQRILASFPDSNMQGNRARDIAYGRIAELIESNGRGVYASAEKEFQTRVSAALQAADPDALLITLDTFPNAASLGEHVLKLGELLLKKERYEELFVRMNTFVRLHPSAPEMVAVFTLLARGAAQLKNVKLSHALAAYPERKQPGLKTTGLDLPPLDLPPVERRPEPGASELSEANAELDFGDVNYLKLQEVAGDPPPRGCESMALVWRDGLLSAIDLKPSLAAPSGPNASQPHELWNMRLADTLQQARMWAFYSSEMLVLVYEDIALGLMPLTGTIVWRRDLIRRADQAELGGGLLFVVTSAWSADRKSSLVAIEPSTGITFYTCEMKDETVTEEIQVVGSVFATALSRSEVRVHDLVTGEVLLEKIEHPALSPRMMSFPDLDLLVIPKRDKVIGGGKSLYEDSLIAVDGKHGAEILWTRKFPKAQIDNNNKSNNRPNVFRYASYIAVIIDGDKLGKRELHLLDPRTGETTLKPVEIASEKFSRLEVAGDERGELPVLFIASPGRNEKNFTLRALDPTRVDNALLWERPLEVDTGHNPGQQIAARVGSHVALAVSFIPVNGLGNETLLFLLQASDGSRIFKNLYMADQSYKQAEMQILGNVIALLKPERLYALSLR